jgi:hypothetical protein
MARSSSHIAVQQWLADQGSQMLYITPGSP